MTRTARQTSREIPPPRAVAVQIVHLTFADSDDPSERQFLLTVPTSFSLQASAARRVSEAGAQLLRQNAGFKELLSELRFQTKPREISCLDELN
jgi:hypothetical protein